MAENPTLTSSLQLCLAHYCDIHGPTPLMVTEGLRATCSICFEEPGTSAGERPQSSTATTGTQSQAQNTMTDALRDLNINRSISVPASEQDGQTQRAAFLRSAASSAASASAPAASASALETPPDSPRPPGHHQRRDSSFRRTYDETVTKKQGPCDNCAMTLPRKQSSAANVADTVRGPTLRTRAPTERVFGAAGQTSPPNSQSSSDTDGNGENPRARSSKRGTGTTASSRTTSCSSASTTSDRRACHVHYVDYTSTHEPVFAESFSLVRASCLRTLSFETLPRAPSTFTPTSPPQQHAPPSFVTTQSAGSAASGGPIFFGDALAGYTTAYIFRIPDVHARGHKRVYAFLALSTHKERLAMKTFAVISAAFRDMATWIQQLAEAEAERAAESSPIGSVLHSGGVGGPLQRQPSAVDPPATVDRSASSFLTGGSGFTRRTGGGGGASALKARGLAELVGQPDLFIELHKKFVQLLFEVGVTLGS